MQFSRLLFISLFVSLNITTAINPLKFLKAKMGATISVAQWYAHGKKHFTKYVGNLSQRRDTANLHVSPVEKVSHIQCTPPTPELDMSDTLRLTNHQSSSSAGILRGAPGADGVDMEGRSLSLQGKLKPLRGRDPVLDMRVASIYQGIHHMHDSLLSKSCMYY
jgi:hypothetical protein